MIFRTPFYFILSGLCLLSQSLLFSQAPEIIWEKGFGGNNDDRALDVIQTPDGGYLAIGYTNSIDGDISLNHGDRDYWVIKTNSFGELEWQKSYGGSENDYGNSVCLGIDGGYVLAGETSSSDGDISANHGESDFWIVKIDDFGNIQWQKTYGGSQFENASSIIQTSDGFYIVAGNSSSLDGDVTGHTGIEWMDYWVIKLDINGNIIWQNCLGSTETDEAYQIIETTDGGFVIVGSSDGSDGDVVGNWGNTDYWIVKLDHEGNLIWQKVFGGSDSDIAHSVVEKENGGFICAGDTYSNDGFITGFHGFIDSWIISLDSTGNLEWQNTFGGYFAENATSIVKLPGNEYGYIGTSHIPDGDVTENNGGSDYWIVKIDSTGHIIWQKSLGGSEEDVAYSIITTLDGHLLAAGMSRSSDLDVTGSYLYYNYWIVKLGICTDIYYADVDDDGFGDILSGMVACDQPVGFVVDSTDCNDGNNAIYPGAEDVCNAIDDNCNGMIDEDGIYTLYYADADSDDFGSSSQDSLSCNVPVGYVLDSTDCDDTNPDIYPGADEILNGVDDNCNTLTDEGVPITETQLNTPKIYPNPTINKLYIKWSGNEPATIQVINNTGEIVATFAKEFPITEINVINYSPGIYLIKSSTEITGLKFIKE